LLEGDREYQGTGPKASMSADPVLCERESSWLGAVPHKPEGFTPVWGIVRLNLCA